MMCQAYPHRTAVLLTALLLLAAAVPARAQRAIDNLNRDTFVEGLRNWGMNELLVHLAETRTFEDPADAARLRIDVLFVKAQSNQYSMEERSGAAEDAFQSLRELIKSNFDHVKRPVWQTELAEKLLFLYLTSLKNAAIEFYQLGVPNAEQHEAYETVVAEAYEHLKQADQRFFQLQGDLPKQKELYDQLVNNGQWDRMIRDFWETRTRFLLARSGLCTSFLPDSHPYYQQKHPAIPTQKEAPGEERQRLAREAIDNAGAIAPGQVEKLGLVEPVQLVIGLGHFQLGEFGDAIKVLEKVETPGVTALAAAIGAAQARAGNKQVQVALDELDVLTTKPPVTESLLFRLLVVDAKHRVLMRAAQKPQEREKAYQPYLDLLEEESLRDVAEALRGVIFQRWVDSTPKQKYPEAASVVLMGIGHALRLEGQNLVAESYQAAEANDEALATQKREQAREKLTASIEALQTLLGREEIAAEVRARAMYNEGFATYLMAPDELGGLLGAARIWTDLAEQIPDQPIALEAIETAIGLLQPLYDPNAGQSAQVRNAVEKPYVRAAQVLLEKFPTSNPADNERLFYAFYVLQDKRQYEAAIEVYKKLPAGHPDYLQAQAETVYCLQQLFVLSDDAVEQRQWADRLRETAIELERVVTQELQVEPPEERARMLRRVLATVLLAKAEIDLGVNYFAEAIKNLSNFDQRFPGPEFQDMNREALEKLIIAYIGAEKFTDAIQTTQDMMDRYPDAAASVIDGVLRRLEREIAKNQANIERLRARSDIEATERRIKQMADTANEMADLLLAWAKSKPEYGPEQMAGFIKIKAKALSLIGDHEAAIQTLQPLQEQFPNDAGMLYAVAEAYYLKGESTDDVEALKESMTRLNTLIRLMNESIEEVKQHSGLREIWWGCWMRRLQVQDKLYELHKGQGKPNRYAKGVEDIPLRVKQLEQDDPNLGGDPYRAELERLRRKHSL